MIPNPPNWAILLTMRATWEADLLMAVAYACLLAAPLANRMSPLTGPLQPMSARVALVSS